ncbi:MAG TPA: tRNA 2-thiouridine(34) synthase MnmA [Acidimicrobiales bacterium]|nr:tRNA 2-thiouridine(34) synthase MnmA [Acidimicrobiales bacterium]
MRVLVAMSGGVDSSVAAAVLAGEGHDVVGATMKLWGGQSDTGCCSVGDVEDARWVARQLGIDHHVFNFSSDFDRHVVGPYVGEHLAGRTPNPCVECNRHIKFDRLMVRAAQLGFDAVATGHHARVRRRRGRWELLRGADPAKDQSYVLAMIGQAQLSRLLLPVGEMTKPQVRALGAEMGLRTAAKPDSQDVCFVGRPNARGRFLSERAPLHPGRLVDAATGEDAGAVEALELLTVGQRRGIGPGPDGRRRYVLAVDPAAGAALVGGLDHLMVDEVRVGRFSWVDGPVPIGAEVDLQASAHGATVAAVMESPGRLRLAQPVRRVAPGQTVALYDGDRVLGSAVAA